MDINYRGIEDCYGIPNLEEVVPYVFIDEFGNEYHDFMFVGYHEYEYDDFEEYEEEEC